MNKYSAMVKDRDGELIEIHNREYPSIAEFKADLKANGFMVSHGLIARAEKYDELFTKINRHFELTGRCR